MQLSVYFAAAALTASTMASNAAEVKVLSAGAYAQVFAAIEPSFEKSTGDKVSFNNDVAGQITRRVAGGERADVVILPPASLRKLEKLGKILPGTLTNLVKVGIGVAVKKGDAVPDIKTLDAFKRTILAAHSISYVNPAYGGSSGIYIDKLWSRLGIENDVRPKVKLKRGGAVADWVADGTVEIGIQQISEIVPVKGVIFVGPLPASIQSYTTYAAAIPSTSKNVDAAKSLIGTLASSAEASVIRSKGMEPAR